jgi:hypothetical protein
MTIGKIVIGNLIISNRDKLTKAMLAFRLLFLSTKRNVVNVVRATRNGEQSQLKLLAQFKKADLIRKPTSVFRILFIIF